MTNRQTARTNGRIILAWGEVTGHHHEVVTAATEAVPDESQAMFFTHDDGTRELVLLAPCVLRHEEHGRITCDPDEAARGARGERDTHGRLVGQYRQGDVFMHPTGPGTWQVIQQNEGYSPESWRAVQD